MAKNPVVDLRRYGQSVWYDNIRRGSIASGELKRMMEEDGVSGVTSNPTIFEGAISGSADYDDAIMKLVGEGKSVEEIYEALVAEDIRMAADILKPVFDETGGRDGYVSVEVSPKLAHDTEGTVAEALRLRKVLGRENVMIKVPATPEGVSAMERLIGEGVNVNATLIFSTENYERVAKAYIAGLEVLARKGKPLDRAASVASLFVSRVDTAVDGLLEERIGRSEGDPEKLKSLLGKAAIANAKMTYLKFKEIFSGERFSKLRKKGAKVQRLLWASTGTKNPNYSDVLYVEELIGPDTVTTLPPSTLAAFKDHGTLRNSLEEGVDEAQSVLRDLADAGIDLDEVCRKLQESGVKSFADSFNKLISCIEAKREAISARRARRWEATLGEYEPFVRRTLESIARDRFAQRLWEKDAALWKDDPQHKRVIKNRLGWLTVTDVMEGQVEFLKAFADEIRRDGFAYAVLLGMGGSSLCPEVCRLTYGVIPGYPDLAVLDSTDPTSIKALEGAIDLARTIFIVSTKSGTTTETLSFYKYFRERVREIKGALFGESFIAITDPGTPLERMAAEDGFRRVFLNPQDIGGRYSALSYFGLVPAAIMGIDIASLLDRADKMATACAPCVSPKENPGVWLGAIMAELAGRGRDKVTFVIPPALEAFGYWAEQLLAESTGKEGKGLVPIEGEPLGAPSLYGEDRLFVYLRLASQEDKDLNGKVRALEAAGHPVVRLTLSDTLDMWGEFFLWEVATAVSGALMRLNPFDEPNVQESKDNTKSLLSQFISSGKLPEGEPAVREGNVSLYCDPRTLSEIGGSGGTLRSLLSAHLRRSRPGDYIALMAYLHRSAEAQDALGRIRLRLRDSLRSATMLGYGPRFLHSTGQLHKGGSGGLFIQITSDVGEDVPIPGEPYTFGILERAQALGDLASLQSKGRCVVRLHLTGDVFKGLEALDKLFEDALAS
ncbi:MAG: bifunctional transaldolase/phosoglucose isomerase [bacterium]